MSSEQTKEKILKLQKKYRQEKRNEEKKIIVNKSVFDNIEKWWDVVIMSTWIRRCNNKWLVEICDTDDYYEMRRLQKIWIVEEIHLDSIESWRYLEEYDDEFWEKTKQELLDYYWDLGN